MSILKRAYVSHERTMRAAMSFMRAAMIIMETVMSIMKQLFEYCSDN